MPSHRSDSSITPEVLDETADWLMRLSESNVTDADRAEWARWHSSSPECIQAWARAELLLSKLGGLPPSLAMSALDRPANPARRQAMVKLASILALIPASWGSWKLLESQQWTADYRTAVGEHRQLTLADGTQLTLNTASSVDVRFDSQQRLVWLRQGEILVQTAADNSSSARPFVVSTREGRMQALGTRFTVREQDARTHLAVLEGSVKVELANQGHRAPLIINAGQRTHFSAQTFSGVTPATASISAWAQGMLMADNMRLADFVAELARYRHGFVRCDPAIADLPISGAFPISDTQRTLNMLVLTYPVVATGHLNGYWVMLSPA